jgi:hypothetical protein
VIASICLISNARFGLCNADEETLLPGRKYTRTKKWRVDEYVYVCLLSCAHRVGLCPYVQCLTECVICLLVFIELRSYGWSLSLCAVSYRMCNGYSPLYVSFENIF